MIQAVLADGLRFGGDYLGGQASDERLEELGIERAEEEIPTASVVVLEDGARLTADALVEGDGGQVIVWADDAQINSAEISATGGTNGGNGGFVETSAAYLQFDGTVDATAANGTAGTWLLDPLDITIDDQSAANTDWIAFIDDWPLRDGSFFEAISVAATQVGSVIAVELIEFALNQGINVVITTLGTSGSQSGDIHLRTDVRVDSPNGARLSLIADDDIIIDPGVDVISTGGSLIFELVATGGEVIARRLGRIELDGGHFIVQFEDGAEISSNFDMPDRFTIIVRNTNLGSRRRRIDIQFDDDDILFDYSGEVADFYPGAISLADTTSDGFLHLIFDNPVDAHLYNFGILARDHRGWQIDGIRSWGVIDSDALDGIPEIVGPNVNLAILAEPGSGFKPVVEVSDYHNQRDVRLIPTSPGGQAILEALSEALEVVQEVENEAEQPFIGPIQPTPLQRAIASYSEMKSVYDDEFDFVKVALIIDNVSDNATYFTAQLSSLLVGLDSSVSTAQLYSIMTEIMEALAVANGLTLSELRLFNDGRNSNQDFSANYSQISNDSAWSLSPIRETEFHIAGLSRVEKWTNANGQEYVFDLSSGSPVLLYGGRNSGTYNYGPDPQSLEHVVLDILPWLYWGTGANDSSTFADRMDLMQGTTAISVIRALANPLESTSSILGSVGGENLITGPAAALRQ